MSRLALVTEQIDSIRQYTLSLLEGIEIDQWFWQPGDGVTHIAWQAGHLAAAQYYLTLFRIRGPRKEDASLISSELLKLFGKGSTPDADPQKYPPPEEILAMLGRVHGRALEELHGLAETVLDEPIDPPHPMFATKQGALWFCPQHEMLHAGQIGLLRRLLGLAPLR